MAVKYKKVSAATTEQWREILLDGSRGAIMGSLATVLAVMLFALAIQLFNISDAAIPVVNTLIKILSLLVATGFALWQRPSRGWIKGGVCGVLYAIVLYMAFSLVDGVWAINLAILLDLVISAAIGAVSGIVMVNVRLRIKTR